MPTRIGGLASDGGSEPCEAYAHPSPRVQSCIAVGTMPEALQHYGRWPGAWALVP
jgi:hypothetical protein